jgi:hypothetical protein
MTDAVCVFRAIGNNHAAKNHENRKSRRPKVTRTKITQSQSHAVENLAAPLRQYHADKISRRLKPRGAICTPELRDFGLVCSSSP